MQLRTLKDINELKGKKVLLRADLNVPLNKSDKSIQDDTRIKEVLPTIQYLCDKGAKVILISHLGRPEGEIDDNLRLNPIAKHVGELLNTKVKMATGIFSQDVLKMSNELKDGEIMMLENIRFDSREKTCDEEFSKNLASLGDIYVNDAFGTSHRNHASITGIPRHLPSYAGLLMEQEITMLTKALKSTARPITLIAGGAKIDTKIGVIEKFIEKADYILVGGGIANTFLHAKGYYVGESLFQKDKSDMAKEFITKAKNAKKEICIPEDVVVADELLGNDSDAKTVKVSNIEGEMKIFDIGEKTAKSFSDIIAKSKTVIWNGPVGIYEYEPFANGTRSLVKAIAANKEAFTVIGGGDTIDAAKRFGANLNDFTHVSTGGGASLMFLEGDELPGIEVLKA